MPKIVTIGDDIWVLEHPREIKLWRIYSKRWKRYFEYGRIDFNPIRFPVDWVGKKIVIKLEVKEDETKSGTGTAADSTAKTDGSTGTAKGNRSIPHGERQRGDGIGSSCSISTGLPCTDDEIRAEFIPRQV